MTYLNFPVDNFDNTSIARIATSLGCKLIEPNTTSIFFGKFYSRIKNNDLSKEEIDKIMKWQTEELEQYSVEYHKYIKEVWNWLYDNGYAYKEEV